MASYASLVDAGDFAGVGALFASGAFVGNIALEVTGSTVYRDTFARQDGEWHFTERQATVDLVGDVRHHLHATGS